MKIITWCKEHAMPLVSLLAAAVTAFFVVPDKKYIDYYDLKTLACLFSVLAVVGALKNLNFFASFAQQLAKTFKTVRSVSVLLVIITMVGSMLLTNDTALLTFLPLSLFVMQSCGQEKHLPLLFVLQNCAANLCGMITPFGNPQNLYLFSYYGIKTGEFFEIMFLPFALSTALILLCCLIFPKTELSVPDTHFSVKRDRLIVYAVLFIIAVLMVLRVIPYLPGTAVIIIALLLLDKAALKSVDWGLIITFVAFFTFSGNLARIKAVEDLFASLLSHGTMLISALTSQVISNVPAAILLSKFTNDYRGLLVGVNIGGAGTLIASLASLITFREYTRHFPKSTGKFFILFSVISFAFLIVLIGVMSI